jgi:predicted membrane protein
MAYEKSESWLIISELLTTRLSFSYVTMQMIVGGLIPLILLAVVVLMNRYLHDRVRNTLAVVASILLLVQVFAMRWNIVIGGQLLSKSLRGLRSPYEPEILGREGVLMAMALFVAPFVILWVFDRVLGIEEPEGSAGHGRPPAAPAVSEAPAASHVP